MAATRARTPPVNATLTRVYAVEHVPTGGGGYTEQNVEKWTGSAPAFATEKIAVEAGSSGPVEVYTANVVVPSSVPVEVGDRLEFDRGGQTELRQVDSTENRSDFGFTRTYVSEPS